MTLTDYHAKYFAYELTKRHSSDTWLDEMIEAWSARLLRIKLDNETAIAPSPAELDGLTRRASDPLISLIAAKLVALASSENERAAVARIALRELHAASRAQ